MGTYIYLAFCRITCLCSYLESGKHWKITDKRGCLRRAFPSIDLLSNAKEADLHFYSAQLVCGSNAQRPVTWWAGGGEGGCVSQTLQLALKGAVAGAGVKVKASVTAAGGSFPLPPCPSPPPRAAPAAESGARSIPGAAPAAAATSGRRPPHTPRLGDPHPHPTGAAHATDTLPCLRRGGVLLFFADPPSRGIPALHRQGVRMPLAKDHVESGAMLGKNKAGAARGNPSSHGPQRAVVSPSFRTAARRRGVRLRPARTNLTRF